MSTRLRVTLTLAVVTTDGGVIREQSFGSIVPGATVQDTEKLAGILHHTVAEELPTFLKGKQ